MAAAFDLSYQDLTTGQQRLFRRLGLHPGTEIDAYAAAALDDTDLQASPPAPGELHDQNLIGEPGRGRYRLHDLLREHARTLAAADDDADNQAAIGRLLDYYLHTAVIASRHTAWRTFHRRTLLRLPRRRPGYRNCARRKRRSPGWGLSAPTCTPVSATPPATGTLRTPSGFPAAMSGFLHFQGHWNEAVTLSRAALAAARTVGDQHDQARALTQLGVAQKQTGDYPAAAASLTRGAAAVPATWATGQFQAWALTQLGRGAAADRGLPGRRRQPDPRRCSCPATWATGRSRPGPSTQLAWCSSRPGITRPPPPA